MRALILAAGRGRRLAADHPKCLLEVNGRTLLERHLEALGTMRVTVVVGYQQEKLRAALGSRADVVENPRFTQGSIRSLGAGLERADDDLLVMDADVIYHPDVIGRLVATPARLAFAVDPRSRSGGEEMMVTVVGGRVREVSRRPVLPCDWMGETVGFTKVGRELVPALRGHVVACLAEGLEGDYEAALDRLVKEHAARAIDVSDLPWTEIDFPEDVEKARALARELP
jgi:choline kinase